MKGTLSRLAALNGGNVTRELLTGLQCSCSVNSHDTTLQPTVDLLTSLTLVTVSSVRSVSCWVIFLSNEQC